MSAEGRGLSCVLCGEPLTLTPWGPVGERGPCRPIEAEIAGADDDGLHVLMTPASTSVREARDERN